MTWLECKVPPIGVCLNTQSPDVGAILGGCGNFRADGAELGLMW